MKFCFCASLEYYHEFWKTTACNQISQSINIYLTQLYGTIMPWDVANVTGGQDRKAALVLLLKLPLIDTISEKNVHQGLHLVTGGIEFMQKSFFSGQAASNDSGVVKCGVFQCFQLVHLWNL